MGQAKQRKSEIDALKAQGGKQLYMALQELAQDAMSAEKVGRVADILPEGQTAVLAFVDGHSRALVINTRVMKENPIGSMLAATPKEERKGLCCTMMRKYCERDDGLSEMEAVMFSSWVYHFSLQECAEESTTTYGLVISKQGGQVTVSACL